MKLCGAAALAAHFLVFRIRHLGRGCGFCVRDSFRIDVEFLYDACTSISYFSFSFLERMSPARWGPPGMGPPGHALVLNIVLKDIIDKMILMRTIITTIFCFFFFVQHLQGA